MNDRFDLTGESRLPRVGTTIFAVMSQLAERHGAINLSQGFPDFSCPPRLMALVDEAIRAGHNQYAPMPGVPALREQIAAKVADLYGAEVDMDTEITITAGATEALFVAIQTCVRPGDEVILFDPAYDSYQPAAELAGGRCTRLPLSAPDYRIDFNRLEHALSDDTRLVVLNSPHNPTGAVLEVEDLDRLEQVLARSGAYVLSDEVYEHIIFDGQGHQSLLGRPGLRERAFVVSSFGKTSHTTGWKVGYCIAPPALTGEFRKIHQFVTFAISTPMQHAIAEFMQDPSFHLELPVFYEKKRDRFRAAVSGSAWEILPCNGTYFQLLGYRMLSDLPDMDLARWLTEHAGVGCIPISVFYPDGRDERVLRFCFAKDDATLDQAARRLVQLSPDDLPAHSENQ